MPCTGFLSPCELRNKVVKGNGSVADAGSRANGSIERGWVTLIGHSH